MENPVLFFDGVCAMCNGLVRFVLKHDQAGIYKFATLQGHTAKIRIPNYTQGGDLATVVLLDENGLHTYSDAIINLLVGLGGYFKIAKILKIIPKIVRDAVYRFIAKNRYHWFGQVEACALLTKEEQARIMD